MGKTITTHNGSVANRAHNIRNPKATDKQDHIDKSLSGGNEMLIDEPPRDAYKRIFGAALEEYNAKQTRPERRIKDYYNHIDADEKKHTVYEMIVQVGDKNDTGIDAPRERAIIKEFIAGWSERNPNLELIGAYIHADERDGTLHAHLDYIPVAHGYKNGPNIQNGLVRALGEQGIETVKQNKETAQIRWERAENAALETICNRHGIEVEHPSTGRKHLDTPEYKEFAAELERIEGQIQDARNELVDTTEQLEHVGEQLEAERAKIEAEREALKDSLNKLQSDKMNHEKAITAYEKQKTNLKTKTDALTAKTKVYSNAVGSRKEIREIDKRKKDSISGRVSLTPSDYDTLKATAMIGAYYADTREEHEAVLKQNKDLEKRVEASKTSIIGRLQGDNRLEKELGTLRKQYAAAKRVLDKNGLEKELKAELAKPLDVDR